MFNFKHSGLSQKLTTISIISTGSALLLVFLAFAVTSVLSHTEDERKQLISLADVIGVNSVSALLFVDSKQAEQNLAALAVKDDIVQAALFDREGKLFARYTAPGRSPSDLPNLGAEQLGQIAANPINERSGSLLAPGVQLYRPVRSNQYVIGAVMIEGAQTQMWLDILKSLGLTFVATLVSFVIALLMAARFKHSIAQPIGELISAARQVSSSQTYTHRIVHQRSDELGVLIDSFNGMLAQLEGRDATLVLYREQLERQVSVRTEQLEKAKNAAEAASQAKSAFLATMSHEIRTPMNGVLGMTELLLASNLTEQQRHYTQMVQRSGEHLLVIINDILDFSKIEAGKLTVEYIHFNFRELLDDLEHVFAPQAQAKNIGLEFAVAHDIPIGICGDPNRLRQILVNLLGNAVKFTDRGQITVRIAVQEEDTQAVALRFEVRDTGIGVSHEARARIFDSFSQADGSTTRKHGGTGLGLAISKQLVELMGGEIGVDNALPQGSVFWFVVNFDKRRVDVNDPSFSPNLTQGLRALIVDDNSNSRAGLERQLNAWRIATDAASADDALPRLRQAATQGAPFDVALLDMELRRTSGLALAAAIAAARASDPALAGLRLLLLSSERSAADQVQQRAAGVAYQLVKPARPCDLFDCLIPPARAAAGATAAAPQPATQNRSGPPPAGPAAARPRTRGKRRVLLAEDNPVNVEVASAMLEGLGLDVSRAVNGAEALHSVQAGDYDLVLMDCQMPVMDGFAATSEIRRHERARGRERQLPIIAITANALQGDRESCLAAGMDDYLSKPFTQQALGQTLSRWISLPRAAWPLQEASPASASSAAAPSMPPAPADSLINHQALNNIRALSPANGSALLERVLHAYLRDTPGHLNTLRNAIAARDTGSLRKAAHSLKSSSANVGAEALAQLCKDMEQLGRNDIIDGTDNLLAALEREFQSASQALGAILEKEH